MISSFPDVARCSIFYGLEQSGFFFYVFEQSMKTSSNLKLHDVILPKEGKSTFVDQIIHKWMW